LIVVAAEGTSPLALVLSGGGARGAYEMGVLRFALGKLAARLGRGAAPRIFCGTSVGAINACALAARAAQADFGVRDIIRRWSSLRLEQVFRLGWGDLAGLARWLIGRSGGNRITSLLDAAPLASLVREVIPWRTLHENVANGLVDAVTVSATDIETGHVVTFLESAVERIVESTDASVEWAAARLRPQHALASAAIPIVFPTVRVAGRIFSDGGVRQNTPISPAVRLGAGRVLVIGLRADQSVLSARAAGRQDEDQQRLFSSPVYLFGKVLDALLLDRVESDLANLRRVNAALSALDPAILAAQPVALALAAAGGGMRPVRDLFIRPSQDLGKLAADVLLRPPVRARLSGPAGYLLRRIAESASASGDPSDLVSYLLFDGEYADELIALGERDARSQADELEAFLTA
jgi:NTE family protein